MITPGRLLYIAWHRPMESLARSIREGGPLNQWRNEKGRMEMLAAAGMLTPSSPPLADAREVWFLTGKKYWYQTAFCFRSLEITAGPGVSPVFVDDGSFDAGLKNECKRIFPGCRIVDRDDIAARLDGFLPEKKFPALRRQRLSYFHLRKLTDVHAGLDGWRLVLDSDMLFFRRPDALLAWLQAPDRPIHMQDVQNAYGYPMDSLATLASRPLPQHLNVGVCGLKSDGIDWERLEFFCSRLLAQHGTSYYLEQALVALLLAGVETLRLPEKDYLLMPNENECRHPSAALHHYVAESKRGYFRHAWRHFAAK